MLEEMGKKILQPYWVKGGGFWILSFFFFFLNKAKFIKTWQECVFIRESLSSLLYLLATGTRCPFWNISLSLAGTALKFFSCETWVKSQRWVQLIVLGEAVKIITCFHLYCLYHSNTPWARPFLYSTIRGRLWSFRAEKMTFISLKRQCFVPLKVIFLFNDFCRVP